MRSAVKGTVVQILLLSAFGLASGENDCYFNKAAQEVSLGNSRIEIRLDPANGVVTGLLNKRSGTEYLGQGKPEVFRLVFSTVRFHGAQADDLWSAVSGTDVKSSLQRVASMNFERTPEGARLTVDYDRLRLEKRTIDVGVRYTIELRDGDEETLWQLSLDNRDQGIVREVHFPLLNGLTRLDSLIMPNESGQKLTDPIDRTLGRHPGGEPGVSRTWIDAVVRVLLREGGTLPGVLRPGPELHSALLWKDRRDGPG